MTITDVEGFEAAGIACGIKQDGLDLCLIATSDRLPVTAAGVFTKNKMTAAPVLTSRANLATTSGEAAAIIINSGNANAATGAKGLQDSVTMCEAVATEIGVDPAQVLVCSTGLIGFELPIDKITDAVPQLVSELNSTGGTKAAEAIMTTDTVAKQYLSKTKIGDQVVTVGGIAKGAAMLEPNMATMLAVITTDAKLTATQATDLLQKAVVPAFNSLIVDGAQSTNDTVLLLANGKVDGIEPEQLLEPLSEACVQLAVMMADDAEGSTKTVFVNVVGASDDDEAANVARAIANNNLVKCSWYGKDPYWGRVASEAGSAATQFAPETLTISYGDIEVYKLGEPQNGNAEQLAQLMEQRHLHLTVDLGQGDGAGRVIATDLTHAYIDENMGTS